MVGSPHTAKPFSRFFPFSNVREREEKITHSIKCVLSKCVGRDWEFSDVEKLSWDLSQCVI